MTDISVSSAVDTSSETSVDMPTMIATKCVDEVVVDAPWSTAPIDLEFKNIGYSVMVCQRYRIGEWGGGKGSITGVSRSRHSLPLPSIRGPLLGVGCFKRDARKIAKHVSRSLFMWIAMLQSTGEERLLIANKKLVQHLIYHLTHGFRVVKLFMNRITPCILPKHDENNINKGTQVLDFTEYEH